MKLISTRSESEPACFGGAIFQGLAPDGGLYLPADYPDLSLVFESLKPDVSFLDVATRLTVALLQNELSEPKLIDICEKAFPFSPTLVKATDQISILELFHGPSCAFKDFGASFLATSMEAFLETSSSRSIILTATSGDTGSAVAQAFKGKDAIDVVILYPSGRVSPLQEKQLTTIGQNVHALEVKGSFDDCQRLAKEAFLDPMLKEALPLTSANSINIGRLLPQSFYYAYGMSKLQSLGLPGNSVFFCVPSGNFGNLTAGVLAWKSGMNIGGFIAATNINDVVPEYLKSGIFTPAASKRTYSNAMDVGNPSNFERLLTIFKGDWKEIGRWIRSEIVTDDETVQAIHCVFEQLGITLDPHSAVGFLSAERQLAKLKKQEKGAQMITLATAHPAKFTEIVEKATRKAPKLPGQLRDVLHREKNATVMDNALSSLREYLLDTFH